MKNDLEFCIAFIQEIEQNPALYDCTLQDYSNRRITELIWNKVGEKFNETAQECKNKWKIIRSSYIRSLNANTRSGSKAGSKKPYYLGQYLRFLNPFTKNRPQEGNIKTPGTGTDRSQEESNIDSFITQDEYKDISSPSQILGETTEVDNRQYETVKSPSDLLDLPPHTSSDYHAGIKHKYANNKYRKGINTADQCAVGYCSSKKKRYETTNNKEAKDPCEHFLLSLVPYIKSMSQLEQLSFQKGVLNLIENTIKSRQPQTENQNSSNSD